MASSVLDAIKNGIWDYEPESRDRTAYAATKALPGSTEKLVVLSRRVEQGLPLWHPGDRLDFSDMEGPDHSG